MDDKQDQPRPKQRPRGILSPADRQFLRGEKELSDSAERNARQRIRERVHASLADFELLWTFLSERDLQLLFDPDSEEERRNLRSWSHYAIAFIRLGLWTNQDPHPDRIADALEQAAFAADQLADAEVDLETEPAPEGDLLLATMQDKNDRIAELGDRIAEEDLGQSSEEELREEARREGSYLYQLFQRGMMDSSVDSEALATIDLLDEESELTAEIIEQERRLLTDTPVVRPSLPVLTDISRGQPDTSTQQSDTQTEDNQ